MKSKIILLAVLLQTLFTAVVFGQKYQNGTRLLKGAEVMSATPLQLDYVLETLADTAKITVNLHEGKTHLVLDDGSGKWREWWYYMGKWQVKNNVDDAGGKYTLPTATSSILGGVKIGNRLSVTDDGTLSANAQAWADITGKPTIPSAYTLPAAKTTTLGGIKIGSGLSATADGTTAINIPGDNNRLLMLYNNQPYPIGHTFVVNNSENTGFTFSGYKGQQYPVQISADASGLTFSSGFDNAASVLTMINGRVSVSSAITGNRLYRSILTLDRERFTATSYDMTAEATNTITFKVEDESRVNSLTAYFDLNKFQISRKRSGNLSGFVIGGGSLSLTGEESSVFSVNPDNLNYGNRLNYKKNDSTLYVVNTVNIKSHLDSNGGKISFNKEEDIVFESPGALKETGKKSVTLSELISKGMIYVQSDEPEIPSDSFAFWVSDSNVWLILSARGTQKVFKIQ